MEFYTNCVSWGDNVLVRGVQNGTHFSKKDKFKPTLFTRTDAPTTDWKSLFGESIEPIDFSSLKDGKDFVKRYEDVENFNIYGNTDFQYQYISEMYQGEIEFDISQVKIYSIDIEVASEFGFPNAQQAIEEVLLITVQNKTTKNIMTFGCRPVDPTLFTRVTHKENYEYVKCKNEIDLLKTFLSWWKRNPPDVITGWYIDGFDIPYLVNRMMKLLPEGDHLVLSPWKIVRERIVRNESFDEDNQTYTIYGISSLDYIKLYKKFTYVKRETYKLDNIARIELDKSKLENPYDSMKEFYTKDFQLFVEYNVVDTELVDMLDEKLKLIELVITAAYEAKCNYGDIFSPVRTWDCILYNAMKEQHIAAPQPKHNDGKEFYGAWVMEPVPGKYKNVVSYDAASLYPSIILECNISPETMVESEQRSNVSVDELLDHKYDLSFLKEKNLTMTANGVCFSKDHQGFIPKVVEKMFKERAAYKKKSLEYEKLYEETKDPKHLRDSIRFGVKELNYKIMLNACYGAMGNKHFRFFDIRMAEGITLTGRYFIKNVATKLEKYLNVLAKTNDYKYWIYTDTDSVYITLEPLLKSLNRPVDKMIDIMDAISKDKLQPKISQICADTSSYLNGNTKIFFKRESLADVGIWTGKKRYILNVYDKEGVRFTSPKVKVTGLQSKSSATPELMRKKLDEVFLLCLKDSESDVHKYVKNLKGKFSTYTPEQIALPKSIDGMSKYASTSTIYGKKTPLQVRAALLFNDIIAKKKLTKRYEAIKDGDNIKCLYLREPNIIRENVIGFPSTWPKELELDEYIDYETMFEKTFLKPLTTVLDAIKWHSIPMPSLDDLFD